MKDTLTPCKRCGSALCYQQQADEQQYTWMCMACGFATSSNMKTGTAAAEELHRRAPELYKSLLYVDDEDLIWYPSTVTVPEVGMIFLDGSSKENWKWKVVFAVPITKKERKKFPKDQTHRMDMKKAKTFEQNEFGLALGELGLF